VESNFLKIRADKDMKMLTFRVNSRRRTVEWFKTTYKVNKTNCKIVLMETTAKVSLINKQWHLKTVS